MKIFTLSRNSDSSSWIFGGDPITAETVESPLPYGTFVLDGKTGVPWKADRTKLGACLHATVLKDTHGLLVSTGAKGARCVVNITGERISKVDWGSKGGIVQNVQLVEKNGELRTIGQE
jgi:hypothetical protein